MLHCELDVDTAEWKCVSAEAWKQLPGKLTNPGSKISTVIGHTSLLSLKNIVIIYLKGKTQGFGR